MTYTWKRIYQIWKHQLRAVLTGLSFNEFIMFYFQHTEKGYVMVNQLGMR